MGKGFRPSASRLADNRLQGNEKTHRVDIDLTELDTDYLDKFMGRITFWSFTYRRIKPENHASKFRVVVHRHIPEHKLIPLVESAFPDGCKVTILMGYKYRHTFDVKTTYPLRWDKFIWQITKSLEGAL